MLCLSLANLSKESMEKYIQLIEEESNFNVCITQDKIIVKEKNTSDRQTVDEMLNEQKLKLENNSGKVFSSLCLNSLFDICDCANIEGNDYFIYLSMK